MQEALENAPLVPITFPLGSYIDVFVTQMDNIRPCRFLTTAFNQGYEHLAGILD